MANTKLRGSFVYFLSYITLFDLFFISLFLNVYYDFQFCISIGFLSLSCAFFDTFYSIFLMFFCLIVCFPKREVKKVWSWAGGEDLGGGEGKQ